MTTATKREFRLPDLGEGVHEGQVLRLAAREGDVVREDDVIMEVETDKAAVEIPSPYAGRIAKWHVEEKQTVNVGDVMVTYADADDASGSGSTEATTGGGGAAAAPTATSAASAAPDAAPNTRRADDAATNGHAGAAGGGRRKPASPAVRKLARTLGVDLHAVDGSGPGGRITRKDVEQAANAPAAATPDAAPAPSASPAPTNRVTTPSPAAPPAAPTAPAPAPAMPAPGAEPEGTPGQDAFGPIVVDTLSRTRKFIAETMHRATTTIPHVTDTDDADVTELDRLRKQFNETLGPDERGEKLSLLPFVMHAVARALRAFPVLNASIDLEREQVTYRRYVHVAVGVQTERGLVAPVVKDADRLGVRGIHAELARLTEKARTGRFETSDGAGATYTISNAGAMGGSRYATPIITPPQVAVLAVGRTRDMPWVVDGEIVPRKIMPLSHSMDHRLIDGAVEIAFLRHVIDQLERPAKLLL